LLAQKRAHFLQKPYNRVTLSRAVRQALDEGPPRRDLGTAASASTAS